MEAVEFRMDDTARPQIEFPKLIDMYKWATPRLDELVSKTLDPSDANEAFYTFAKGEVARSVLTFE